MTLQEQWDRDGHKLPKPWTHKILLQEGKAFPGTPCTDENQQTFALEFLGLHYGDLEAALDPSTVYAPMRSPEAWAKHLKLDNQPDPNWVGDLPGTGTTGERVRALLQTGTPKEAEQLQGLADEVVKLVPPVAFGRRKAFRSDMGGDDLDIGRFLAGDTDFWIDYNRSGKRPSPYVTVVTHYGGSWTRTPGELFWCGAAAAALTDAMEAAGFRVRLLSIGPGQSLVNLMNPSRLSIATPHTTQVPFVVVKDYDEPLRFAPAAFAICHAGFFRTVGFGMIVHGFWGYPLGLGRVSDVTINCIKHLTTDTGILLPRAYTKEAAVKSVQNAISELEQLFDLASVVS